MDVVYTLTQRFLFGLAKQLWVVLRRCVVSEMKYIYWSFKQGCYYSNIYGQIKIYLQSTMLRQRLDKLALFCTHRERYLSSRLWDNLDQLVLEFAKSHGKSKIFLA